MAGSAPFYDNVQWPATGGIRIPTEAFGTGGPGNPCGTLQITKQVTINYAAGHADHTLLPNEAAASEIVCSSTNAAANLILSAANSGQEYVLFNNSSSGITFKVQGGSGVSVGSGKRAILICEADIQRLTADT